MPQLVGVIFLMDLLQKTRRDMLRLIGSGFAAITASPVRPKPGIAATDAVSLPDFRRAADPDDSDALDRAIATGRPIHAPGGMGSGSGGRYLISAAGLRSLPSGFTLRGDGIDHTIIARSYLRAGSFVFFADSGSPDPQQNLVDLALSDLTIEDDVVARGFSEFSYLVMLNGVSGAHIDRVRFRGFRGDGLYIGSSTVQANERHNRDVFVRHCHFDGINANNRNAISILDCDGLLIEHCRFNNVTRPGGKSAADPMDPATGPPMPGAIDLEPERNNFAVLRNVIIRGNHFVGGGGYAVALTLLPNDLVRDPQRIFRVEGNVVERRYGGFSGSGYGGDSAVSSGRPYAIAIQSNHVANCIKPFLLQGIRGLTMANNSFVDCGEMAELGYQATNAAIAIHDNEFTRVGTVQGYGMWIRSIAGLDLRHNKFTDCGRADGSIGIALAFVNGAIRDTVISANEFWSPTGRTTEAATVFRDARLDRRSITATANRAGAGILNKGETLGLTS
jgi:hypothetical protein